MPTVLAPERRTSDGEITTALRSRRLRIAVVGTAGSVHVLKRAGALAERGHDVVVISPTPPLADPAPAPVGSRSLRIEAPAVRRSAPFPLSLLARLRQRRQLRRLIERAEADVVYVHFAAGAAAWLAGALARGPLAVSVMGGDVLCDERSGPSRIERWLTRRLLRRADLITSKSDHLTQALVRMGIDERKVLKVVWGVDLERFRPRPAAGFRVRYGLSASDTVVLCPRIVRELYNTHVIVEAVARLRDRFPQVRLLLTEYAIDPGYRRRLDAQIARLGLEDHVRFLAAVPADSMPELYNAADVVVSIPSSDGLPQSLFESLASGVPAVVGNLDRYREVVQHGESAWFVDLDAAAVAHGLETVLSDALLRRRLIAGGLAAVRRHADAARELDRVEQALIQLAEARRNRGRRRSHLMLLGIAAAAVWNRLRRS